MNPVGRRDGPPPDMGRAVRWWLGGMLLGASMWAALGAVAWWALGCATGHVSPDGEMVCAAIGEDAEVLYSAPQGDAGILTNAPTKQVACRGGPLVPSLLDGVGAMFRAVWALLPWAA